MSNNHNNTPGWVAYLTGAIVLIGLGYAVYVVGFRGQTHQGMINQELGITTIEPKMELVPQRTAATIANGEATYKKVCFACHGANMEGGVGPNLKDADWYHPPAKESNLYKLVSGGISGAQAKKGIPMPAKGGATLSGEQVWEVIYFLGSKNPSIEKDAVPNMK